MNNKIAWEPHFLNALFDKNVQKKRTYFPWKKKRKIESKYAMVWTK